MGVTIYHNPKCGTSRNTLAMIRALGVEPTVIEYLKDPPSRETLVKLLKKMKARPRDILREKGTPYHDLGLGDESLSDEQLIDAMMAHPILINRPIVLTAKGVRLCRPSEAVLEILPGAEKVGPFTKEDGKVGRSKPARAAKTKKRVTTKLRTPAKTKAQTKPAKAPARKG